jgi:hypothetical protein
VPRRVILSLILEILRARFQVGGTYGSCCHMPTEKDIHKNMKAIHSIMISIKHEIVI